MADSEIKPRILIVDDEAEVCALFKEYLEEKRYQIGIAYDGEEALEKMGTFRPDCVLLDMRMPIMGGGNALVEIKSRHPDVPVVMITAVAKVDVAEECLLHGAFAYITKPVDLDYMDTIIQCALEHNKQTAAARSSNPKNSSP